MYCKVWTVENGILYECTLPRMHEHQGRGEHRQVDWKTGRVEHRWPVTEYDQWVTQDPPPQPKNKEGS